MGSQNPSGAEMPASVSTSKVGVLAASKGGVSAAAHATTVGDRPQGCTFQTVAVDGSSTTIPPLRLAQLAHSEKRRNQGWLDAMTSLSAGLTVWPMADGRCCRQR
eukprot:6414615-Prymnesium_polylepis.1